MAVATNVGRYNYPDQFGDDTADLLRDLERMLFDGRYVLTQEVRDFETAFAEYVGARYARGVNSGTDALILALLALGIGPGDEVITQANTFHATVSAICFVGAKPVLVDAEDDTYLIDQSQLPAAISSRTRALIPVHLFGKLTPMDAMLALAERHGLKLIEDAAQAHGATYLSPSDGQWKPAGSVGDVGCFSFHPSKNLAAAGDAGAVVTSNQQLDERLNWLRGLGQRRQNEHVVVGLNSKLDALQARILYHKLPRLEEWNERRRAVAAAYRERLAGLPIGFQRLDADEKHVFHLFQIRTEQRDRLLSHLQAAGVDATVRYPTPIHLQQAFAERDWKLGQFPVAERLAEELLCLPIRPDMSIDEVDYAADCVRSYFNGAA